MVHRGDDVQDLRRKALAALHAGNLPRVPPVRTWGGNGSGDLCPVCGHAIEPEEKELEFEFAAAGTENAVRNLHLHIPCFAAFEFATESAAREARTAASSVDARRVPRS